MEEVHIGTFVWRFSLKLNDKEVENYHISSDINYLEYNLNHYQFESSHGDYVFFPTGIVTIYETKEKSFYSIFSQIRNKGNAFLGNIFIDKQLLVIHEREVYNINLETKESNSIGFFGKQKIKNFTLKQDNGTHIELTMKDGSTKNITF